MSSQPQGKTLARRWFAGCCAESPANRSTRALAGLCVAAALAVCSVNANAACAARAAARTDSPNAYAATLVETLILMRSARDETVGLANVEFADEFITAAQTAGHKYDCAMSYIAPYLSSRVAALASSAGAMRTSLDALQRVNASFAQILKETLAANNEAPPDPLRDAHIVMALNEAWQLEMSAVTTAGRALLVIDPQSKQRSLSLSARERDALVHRLERSFGRLRGSDADSLPPLESSVAALLDFLHSNDGKSRGTT